jgi:hypothetical protein
MADSSNLDIDELRSQIEDLNLGIAELDLVKHGLENASEAFRIVYGILTRILDTAGVDRSLYASELAQLDDLAGRLV